jgi:hypothetical protein
VTIAALAVEMATLANKTADATNFRIFIFLSPKSSSNELFKFDAQFVLQLAQPSGVICKCANVHHLPFLCELDHKKWLFSRESSSSRRLLHFHR